MPAVETSVCWQPALLRACSISAAKRSRSTTGFELHACLQAAVQRRVRCLLEHLREQGVADEPDGDEGVRIEGEVQEGGEVAEELGRQVLRLVDDPQRRDLLGVDQFVHAQLDVAPELGAPVARLQPQGAGQTAVDVDAAEVGLGLVEHQVAVRVERSRQAAKLHQPMRRSCPRRARRLAGPDPATAAASWSAG